MASIRCRRDMKVSELKTQTDIPFLNKHNPLLLYAGCAMVDYGVLIFNIIFRTRNISKYVNL